MKESTKDKGGISLLELEYLELISVAGRRTKCRETKRWKKEGLDLCLEDILVKGLGFGIDQ